MPTTYPNQRQVKIHRERASSDFLGIKNENWQAAARDLRPHALALYLYLAANADNYTLALSPAAVRQSIGMARSTYHDQFQVLVDKGYLVSNGGSTYDFFEIPRPSLAKQQASSLSDDGLNFEEMPSLDLKETSAVISNPQENIEINNSQENINNSINTVSESSMIPKVKEITIPSPEVKARKRPASAAALQINKGEFHF